MRAFAYSPFFSSSQTCRQPVLRFERLIRGDSDGSLQTVKLGQSLLSSAADTCCAETCSSVRPLLKLSEFEIG